MDEKSEAVKINDTPPSPHRKCPFKCVIPTISLILAAAAVGSSAWLWQQNNQFKQILKNTQQSLQQSLSADEATMTQINNNLLKTQNLAEQLNQKMQRGEQNWQRAEAIYLVKLANYQLKFNANVPVAIQLLEDADQQLKSYADSQTTTFRQLLQDTLAKLQNSATVDTTGIILRLNALSDQVNNLSVIPTYTPQTNTETKKVDENKPGWQKVLAQINNALKSLFIIHKHEVSVDTLATPLEQSFASTNIRWQLSLAQWAVIKGDTELYKQSLQRAVNLIQEKFTANSTQQNLISSLQQLASMTVNTNVPDMHALVDAAENLKKAHPSQTKSEQNTAPESSSKTETAPANEQEPTIEKSISS